ncbi:TetR family transcriptional regulator [Nocardia bovistercoris]|uniref:TetR family transcriptional regulator n=1 Tax=Nocardia bovistercoris TaxID=2785916 RepID=A0A931IGF9_9NOCA|nr:TetR family transcriptional regulator [Nocardia bovistercoris]MBH0779910.1 TetR family transcriptional regulator [Nocardia bovistercoris]
MIGKRDGDAARRITEAVLALLESDGYDAVQLRDVARRAQVSLSTIYRHHRTRDELILAAMSEWVASTMYRELAPSPPQESLAEGLMRVLRHVFEPWERNPRMVRPYFRARSGPGGRRLDTQGFAAVLPVLADMFAGVPEDYAADIGLVMTNMIYALIGRCADGDLDSTEILPALERIVVRLTGNNEPLTVRAPRASPDDAHVFGISPSFHSPFVP